ncbi:hypothetical protein V493_04746 [Pseudogymnoascus sp. VKM F-4281 (FW-2241)]|nr:hypothetical protein V493_04746 [Pseudogymnoascus sp. VKM F-4281 (FW-2241)]
MALNMNSEVSETSLPKYSFPPTPPMVKEKRIEGGILTDDDNVRTRKGGLKVGGRIAPVLPHLRGADFSDSDSVNGTEVLEKQLELESGNSLQYRTCSWQKTAFLLFSEYICLAIMSFPWSYSVLGLVPGLILTIVVAACVLYTSLVLWEFCLRHPEVRDVCDIGQMLFWGKTWVWVFMFWLLPSTSTP